MFLLQLPEYLLQGMCSDRETYGVLSGNLIHLIFDYNSKGSMTNQSFKNAIINYLINIYIPTWGLIFYPICICRLLDKINSII